MCVVMSCVCVHLYERCNTAVRFAVSVTGAGGGAGGGGGGWGGG